MTTAHSPAPSSGAPAPPRQLQPSIGLGQGVALYVSAILGAGVLVLPGQVASMAGPASLVAWAFAAVLGVPLALTLASLAVAMPGAGGVATFAARAFGPNIGGVVGWWYFTAGSVGQTIVPLTGGYYLAEALGMGQQLSYPIAALILAAAVAANLAGVKISARVQVALAAAVAAVLLAAVLSAAPDLDPARLIPFAPAGVSGIGQAVVVLFFAFAGWEAVAHLSGEFRDPRRDLRRATVITIVVVSVLYLAVAAAVVLTATYGDPATDRLAIGLLLEGGLGVGAATAAGVAAVVISLGTTNAFIASVSRLGYALALQGWAPAPLGRISARRVPATSVLVVGGIGAAGLALSWAGGWGTEDVVAIPSTLVIATYLVAMACGVRLLTGAARAGAVVALALTAAVLPFAAGHVLVPLTVAAAALAYRRTRRPGQAGRRPSPPPTTRD